MARNMLLKLAAPALGLALLAILMAGSAHAANSVAWVFANQPNTSGMYTPDPQYSFNSTKGSITVQSVGPGRYLVTLYGNPYIGPDDVVISAVNTSGSCDLEGWSTSVTVVVECSDASGKPADAAFTLLYQSRTAPFGDAAKGMAFLLDNEAQTGSSAPPAAQSFNSTGGTNMARRNGVGNYTVTLPGLSKLGGQVQVSPVRYHYRRCKPVSWGVALAATTINVQCYKASGAAGDDNFSLAYAIDEPLGIVPGAGTLGGAWAFANDMTSTSAYTPELSHQFNGFGTGHLTARRTGAGLYTVTIPGTPSYTKSVALVTAVGGGNAYCNIASWTTSAINVACYAQGGAPTDSRFNVTFQTAK
jgi:hypothetical protein